MRARLTRQFDFHAAHRLPRFDENHPCRGLHGHTFTCEVVVEGVVDPHSGTVIMFEDLKAAIKPVEEQLDHSLLNDIAGLEQPTTEYLARWIFDQLKPALPPLTLIRLWETPRNSVEYWGEASDG